MPLYDYDCAACGRRFEVDPRRPRRPAGGVPAVRVGPRPQGDQRSRGPFQGLGLGQEGAPHDVRSSTKESSSDGAESGVELDRRRQAPRRQVDGESTSPSTAIEDDPVVDEDDRLIRCRRPRTGSRSPRPRRSWPPPTSTSRPSTIGGWARDGKLQSIKLGGRRYVRRGEIRTLIAAPRRVPADAVQPALFEDWRD